MAKQTKRKPHKAPDGVEMIADFFGGLLGNVVKEKRKRKAKIEKTAKRTGLHKKKKR